MDKSERYLLKKVGKLAQSTTSTFKTCLHNYKYESVPYLADESMTRNAWLPASLLSYPTRRGIAPRFKVQGRV